MGVHGEWILFSGSGNTRSMLMQVTRDAATNFIANNIFLNKSPKMSNFLSNETRFFLILGLYFKRRVFFLNSKLLF